MNLKHVRRKSRLIIAALVLCLGFVLPTGAQEKQAPLLGYAVIPDIGKTLESLEKIASEMSPDKFKPGFLKGQIGMMLGDPALENIDRTKPAVAMIFQVAAPAKGAAKGKKDVGVAVFLPVKDRVRGQKALADMKMSVANVDNILIVSNKAPMLPRAKKEIALYRSVSKMNLKCDIRMLVKVDQVMKIFEKEIESGMKTVESTMKKMESGEQDSAERKEMENALGMIFLYGMLDYAQQSKDYRLDITLNEKSLIFASEHSARTGTALNRFFNSTPPEKNRCLNLMPEKGMLTYAGYFDMVRVREFFGSVVDGALKKNPSLKTPVNLGLINAYKKYLDMYLGQIALQYGLADNGKLYIHFSADTDKSEAEHIAANEAFMKAYGALLKGKSGTFGISGYTMEKNVRSHKGISIHRYAVKGDYSHMKGESGEIIKKVLGEELALEFAVAGGFIVGSTDKKVLDTMIEDTSTGGADLTLLAAGIFGKGMDSYTDFNLLGLIERGAEIGAASKEGKQDDKTGELIQVMKKLDKEDREILASARYNGGNSYSNYRVPLRMIIEAAKLYMKKPAPVEMPVGEAPGEEIPGEMPPEE